MVDADVGWAAALADDLDDLQCGGRLGLLLGLTFLAEERREISTKNIVYDDSDTTSFTTTRFYGL